MTYTEGILGDGAAILKDGVMVPIEEIVSRLNDMDRFRAALVEIEAMGSRARRRGDPCRVAREALEIETILNP